MKKFYSLLIMCLSMFHLNAQITASGNTSQTTTSYTNGTTNDNIYIWCNEGIGINLANLTATPPSGTGPFTFNWFYHNQTNSSWTAYSSSSGATSTISNLASDGYRVEIRNSSGALVGCYTAWVWNMNGNISAANTATACNATNLTGTFATEGTFVYYNPPPPESIITSTTNISVCFNATHTFVSDLAFYLISPPACGSQVILLSPNPGANDLGSVCNSSDNVNNLCFSTSATNFLNVCAPVTSLGGTYGGYSNATTNTSVNWSPLQGVNCNAAAGGWSVQIYDCIGQDFGALTGASITFSNLASKCGSPTSITYNSGVMNSAINDNSCTAASASIFTVPVTTALTTPITLTATTTSTWTASPSISIPAGLSPSVTNIPTGTTTFTLTGTVSFGGATCTYTKSTNFTNTCCVTPPSGTISYAGPFCSSNSTAQNVTQTGTTGGTYVSTPAGLSLNTTTGAITPSTSTAGTYTVTYSIPALAGCPAFTTTTSVVISTPPVVNVTAVAPRCVSLTTVGLTATPAGGTFSGTGVSGTNFNPSTAGVGNHTISYSVPAANGCPIQVGTTSITVNPLPTPTITQAGPFCVSATAVTLVGTPTGGTFSGTGMTGSNFNPATAGVGSHVITYVYSDANSCTNSTTSTIVVNALPTPTITQVGPFCVDASTVTLVGTPTGGTFSGTGMTGNSLNPATAGVGSHVITYQYTNGNGCTNSTTSTIVVNPLPTPTITQAGPFCVDASAVTLVGTPTGGTFSGTGITGSNFNPATAGVGSHVITYQYTNGNGCTNSTTSTIVVNPLPTPTITQVGPFCVDASAVTLVGTPTGGTFFGTGMTGNSFNPATAGVGSHVITYVYSDGNACTNSTTSTIVVNPLPTPTITQVGPFCVDASAVTLVGTPTGGTFSGTGMTGNSFNPVTAGAGSHVITYQYTNGNGCTNSTTSTIVVNPLPTPTITQVGPFCVDASAITLVGTPTGGTFSGTGMTGSSFNPATAGVGSHVITYVYSDANTCTNSTTSTIVVNPLPTPTITQVGPFCVDASAVTLVGTPTGGTFSGTGMAGNSFNPATAGVGSHVITYQYTNGNGCTNSTTSTIVVNPLPTPTITQVGPFCVDASAVTLVGTPTGGTFSGTGMTGNSFNPATAGVGSHVITYVYSDANTCTNSTTSTIIVNALPTPVITQVGPFCVDASAVTLVGTPTGGTFSGIGISGTSFNPATAGIGSHVITYIYSDGNSCTNSTTSTIVVNPLPTPTITQVGPFCVDASAITLVGTPTGGTFSGTGITGSNFNPATAGVGSHVITYVYSDGNTCTNSTTSTIVVNALPTPTITQVGPFCVDASAITLVGTPTGGTFSGTGMTGSSFNPATAGAGSHVITYVYSDGNSCTNSTTSTIVVNPLPTPTITQVGPFCVDASAVTLVGTPTGGTFSGTGISGTSFNPATAGIGSHVITYVYSDANTCTNSTTSTIVVNPLPTPVITQVGPFCVDASAITLVGTPTGGTFSGTGMTGNSFNPATAGVGSHVITYVYSDGNTCTNSTTSTIVVNPLPTPVITQVGPFCVDASAVTLVGTPTGGTFSGTGMTGNSFNPATAGVGSHVITYVYSDANSCTNSTTSTIVVNALPTPVITQAGPFCVDASAVTLVGTPTGGTFSGTGISGTSFNPATAGVGSHVITYVYSDGNGCTNSTTSTIVVNPLPTPTITQVGPFCVDASAVTLVGTPTGGTFSGTGMTGNSFNPATAGVGSHVITYVYSDGNTCTNSTTSTIVVNPLPTPVITQVGPFCVDASAVTLVGTPAGGTFSGTGMTGSSFNPATAGIGSHVITYIYSDGNSCTNSTTSTIVVNPLPTPTITQAGPFCVDASAVTLVGTPTGGTFSGTGMTGNSFNPATAGVGSHVITYVYSDANTCTNSTTSTIVVNPLPTPTITQVGPFCVDASAITLVGTPTGGTFSGTGITGSNFNPATAGVGSHVITYVYSDANTCTNSTTSTIIVNALPTPTITQVGPFCVDASAVTLVGTPTGGTFSGTGMTGNSFNPATAGVGSHVVTYVYSDGNTCTNSTTSTIVVNPLPTPTITQAGPFCLNTAVEMLVGTPTGGTFSGTGMTGNSFNPATAGVGSHVITYVYSDANTCTNSTTSTIVVNPLPLATIGGTLDVCQNDVAPTITFTGSGTVAPYTLTYSVNGGANQTLISTGNSATITQSTATSGTFVYELISVTDASVTTCSNAQVGTTTIVVKPLPIVSTTINTAAICSNESTAINLTADLNGTTFDWTVTAGAVTGAGNGSGAVINQVLINTTLAPIDVTYTVTPTTNGCVGSPIQIVYTVKPLPTAIANTPSNTLCSGDQTNFSLTSSPSAATYTWTQSASNVTGSTNGTGATIQQILTATTAGTVTYVVTPTLNGCVGSTLNLPVTVNPLPIVVLSPMNPVICAGSSISLTATGASTYVWTPATGLNSTTAATVNASPTQTQTYSVLGTDLQGCVNSATLNLVVNPMPIVTVSPAITICAGDTTTLQANGASTYVWTPATGLSATTGSSVQAFPSLTNTYTVTGTSIGCSTSAYVTVTVNQLPVIYAGADVTVCNGNPITLTATGAISYEWTNNVTNNVALVPTISGTYDVVGTDANGCKNHDALTVTIFDNPTVTFTPSVVSGCSPVFVQFANTTVNGQTYNWDFGDGTSATTQNPSHTYTGIGCFDVMLTATSSNGCVSTLSFTDLVCTELSPIADFTSTKSEIEQSSSFVSFMNQSQNATHYEWYFSDVTGYTSVVSPDHEFQNVTSEGNYEVILVAKNQSSCVDTARMLIRSKPSVLYFVPNAFTPDGDNFNQTFKPVFTSGFDPQSYELKIFNRWGEVLFESHDVNFGWDGSYMQTSDIVQDGAYTWKISFKKTYSDERVEDIGHVSLIR